MIKKVKEAEELNIHVVDEKFIDNLNSVKLDKLINVEEMILKHNIASWGSDLKTRIELSAKTNEQKLIDDKEEKSSKSNVSSRIKMKIKNGAVVDPESGNGHIF